MDTNESARCAEFIDAASRIDFIEQLIRTSPPPSYYVDPHLEEERLQGDLFHDVPFVRIKSENDHTLKLQVAVVLNNTCDLQTGRSDFINFALAADFSKFKRAIESRENPEKARGFLDSVKKNVVNEIFFIPPCPVCESGLIVFLNQVTTIPAALYDTNISQKKRFASLSQHGFYLFLIRLTNFFARIEKPSEITRHIEA
ncbi:MAG: hypothetical protein AB7I98_00010 [Verrucomicrobiales bacterium]